MWVLTIFITVLFTNGFGASTDHPKVKTKVGVIRGMKAADGEYNIFSGIPYAQVNKSNPFGLNMKQPPFQGVFDATKDPVQCMQRSVNYKNMSLDCLQLNIYVPLSAKIIKNLPVLIWIHNGDLIVGWSGKAEAGPKFIVRHDVILVTLNYRLGIYGFMCLDIPEVPGNQGLKDQIAGIKWVKDNIAAFDGDSDKITIMGSGGASVDYLLRFSKPKLFDKVIISSGTSNSYLSLAEPDYQFPIDLAKQIKQVKFKINDKIKALEFLAASDPQEVIAASRFTGMRGSKPCIEKKFNSINRLISEDPSTAVLTNVKTTPILIGHNNAEMGFKENLTHSVLCFSKEIFQEVAMMFGFKGDKAKQIAKSIQNFYIDDTAANFNTVKYTLNHIHFLSDLMIIYSTEKAIDQFIKNGATKIYRYIFTYTGDRNYMQIINKVHIDGAVHVDEVGYLFDLEALYLPLSKRDRLTIDRVTKMWTNFVTFGDPTPKKTMLLPIMWPQITTNGSFYLRIGKHLTVGSRPNRRRMALWNLLHEFNNKPVNIKNFRNILSFMKKPCQHKNT